MKDKPSLILYIYPVRTAFTDRDIEMLRLKHEVQPLPFTQSPVQLPWYFVKQFFQLLYYLPKTSHFLSFFGGYHTVWPTMLGKLFGKKVYIQSGGTDAMNLPAINYGNYRKFTLSWATQFSFRNCDLILPVAASLVQSEYLYAEGIPQKQGLLNLIPNLNTPIQVIPNGFDTTFWRDLDLPRQQFSFISIATGISKSSRARVKGIDLIEYLAGKFPEYHFTLVGDNQYQSPNPNVKVIGKMEPEPLMEMLNTHQFYLQLSMSEGFPNALAEAMLCGCIPIGSAVGAIPEIIGDHGLILEKKDPVLLEKLILGLPKKNLQQLRKSASESVRFRFPYEKRQKALLELFD
ncbi:glycosyltransferase family 4 protein [Pararhodonellum marinum]|uniref:glycosyltransferase family 4 protein n=1 Tax=Pararhodonellum marinum TaxID=2755358 RepID=UPI001E616FB5|nr:glycosyltransferase family 4 protein [Pararhodonellum marinum]